jgi:hypothetical protein
MGFFIAEKISPIKIYIKGTSKNPFRDKAEKISSQCDSIRNTKLLYREMHPYNEATWPFR